MFGRMGYGRARAGIAGLSTGGGCMNRGAAATEASISCLVDNAAIINACGLLADPATFDVHKLADLDTLCQAILLNDSVRTLIGQSFQSGMRFRWPFYRKLIEARILRPRVVSAAGYHISGIERMDAIARALDVDQLISTVQEVFGDNVPWRDQGTWVRGDDFRYGLIYNRNHSDPVYCFPNSTSEKSPDKRDGGGRSFWQERDTRRNSWLPVFVSQTFYYIAESASETIPYYCSGLRVPVVAALNDAVKARFFSVVHGALQHVETGVRMQIREVLDFLGEDAVQHVYLPGLSFALPHIRSRETFVDDLIALRGQLQLVEFRRWAALTRQAWLAQDIRAVRHAIAQLRQVGEVLNGGRAPLNNGTLAFIPKPDLVGDSEAYRDPWSLHRSMYEPAPAFLGEVGAALLSVGETRKAVEHLIGRRLTESDIRALGTLTDTRSALYSPGKISSSTVAQITEITMGDRFDNISNSTIVNRSHVEASFQRISDSGDTDAAEAMRRLATMVEESGDEGAVQTFDSFAEELARPEPRQGLLRVLWEGLVAAIPAIKETVGVADTITKLFA
ncbi:hypothetical protein [Nocardia asiatica]|uniref:hypothetical protein n=1 Tax=Nocardia asiatica TaxID=209252 RepID=UPI002457C09B|nr:hypothetical protein [Nocardia asiatica]